MSSEVLDEVVRGILHLLQEDARHLTPVDMVKELDVSNGTVRNRIEKLEERSVIEGYVPTLNYEAAGHPPKIVFACSASDTRRAELAEEDLEMGDVVNVRELMTPRKHQRHRNRDPPGRYHPGGQGVGRAGLGPDSGELVRRELLHSFDHMGQEAVANK